MEIFLMFDMISPQTQFLINKSSRYRSFLGCIFTVVIFAFVGYILTNGSLGMISRDNPAIRQNQEYIIPKLLLNSTGLPIAFVLGGGNGVLSNMTYNSQFLNFTPFISSGQPVNSSKSGQVQTYKALNFYPCNEAYFGEYLHLYNTQMSGDLKNYYCIDTTDIQLLSTSSIAPYVTLELFFSQCDSTNKLNNCLADYALEQRWKQLVVQFYFLDSYVDINNVTHPIQPYVNTHFYWFSAKFLKRTYFNFNLLSVISDFGWMMQDLTYDNFFQMDPLITTDINDINSNTPLVKYRLSISLTNLKNVYYRNYTKIQNVCGNVGGLFSGLVLLASFINYFFHRNLKYYALSDCYYDTSDFFIDGDKSLKKLYKESSKNISHINLNINQPNNINLNNSNVNFMNLNNSNNNNNFGESSSVNNKIGDSNINLINQINVNEIQSFFNKNCNENNQPYKNLNDLTNNQTDFANSKSIKIVNNEKKINIFKTLPKTINQKTSEQKNEYAKLKKFSLCQKITMSLKCRKLTSMYFRIIENKMDEKLSLEFLFKKYREVDFIRNLLFKNYNNIDSNDSPDKLKNTLYLNRGDKIPKPKLIDEINLKTKTAFRTKSLVIRNVSQKK